MITDVHGNAIAWFICWCSWFQGSRKSTPFAGSNEAETLLLNLQEHEDG